MKSRRKFLVTAASLAAAATVNANTLQNSEEKYIAHQVYFWLKNAGSSEDRAKLIKGIRSLQKIKSIDKLHIGVVAATEKRPVIDDSWSVSLLVLCKDLAAQAAYQVDPIHLEFVKNYGTLWEKVAIYDSALV